MSPIQQRLARESVDQLAQAFPSGSRFVAFVVPSPTGRYRLAHPSGWALVGDDGSLSPLAMEPDAKLDSFLGFGTIDELLAAVK